MCFFRLLGWGIVLILSGCSTGPVKRVDVYDLLEQQHNVASVEHWCLSGRLSYMDADQSVNAMLDWCYKGGEDRIQVSGFWGMGRTQLVISEDGLTVDEGGDVQVYSRQDVNRVVYERIGVDVPLTSLRYWLLGVPDYQYSFRGLGDGFVQNEWIVRYLSVSNIKGLILPEKIKIKQGEVLLKLLISEWVWS